MGLSNAFNLMSNLNYIITDATQSITTGSYDPTKTNNVNRIFQRLITGGTRSTLGASPLNFQDTFDLSLGFAPGGHGHAINPVGASNLARVFIPLTPSTSTMTVAYFTYNIYQDVWAYVGQLKFTLQTATVHTIRGFIVDDNAGSSTGWSVHFETTNATVANGGYFYVPNCTAAQFLPSAAITIPTATTGDTQSSNKVFWVQETGGTNLLTVGLGLAVDKASKVAYSATATTSPTFYEFNYGAIISTVGATGITSDLFVFKTAANATFATALFQSNCMSLAIPKSSQNPSLIGQKCIYISSATTGYHFLASDLSSGSSTVPSLVQWNKLGTGVDFISPTAFTMAHWDNDLDVEFNYSTSGQVVMKSSINNDTNIRIFGKNDITYTEAAGTQTGVASFGLTISGIFTASGILFLNSTAPDQRGCYAINVAADQFFAQTKTGVIGQSYIITPVISVDCAAGLAIAIGAEAPRTLIRPVIQYRTSNFGVFPGTWATLPTNNDLSTVAGLTNISQIQLRVLPSTISNNALITSQLWELFLNYIGKFEISANWNMRVDGSSVNGNTPVTAAARQVTQYGTGPKTIYFNIYNAVSKLLIKQVNTTDNFVNFNKSSDTGATFTIMASANDYADAAGTTVIQYTDPSPVSGISVIAVRDISQ